MNYHKHLYAPREYPTIAWIVIDKYDATVCDIQEIFSILKSDFPTATDMETKVVGLAGNRYAGMISIEYTLPENTKIPDGYVLCDRMEPTA